MLHKPTHIHDLGTIRALMNYTQNESGLVWMLLQYATLVKTTFRRDSQHA